MSTHIEFGQCLDSLLSTLGISINRLAKAINIDSSLVNRWVNGKRIPAYNSIYIENIAEFLAQNIKNSLQAQCIIELFEAVHGYNDEEICIQEKIKRSLYESQGHALKKQKNRTELRGQMLTNLTISNHPICPPTHPLSEAVSLSPDDKIICGTNKIIAACNYLLDLAINTPSLTNKKIHFTCIDDAFFKNKISNEVIQFQNLLVKVLNSGWEIYCLVKITDNNLRTIGFIDFVKPLIGTGSFHLHYVNSYDSTCLNKDYVIVSGVGAVSCFSLHSKDATAFYLRSPDAIAIFENYLDFFTSYHSQPLLTYYTPEMSLDYFSCLAESEDTFGNRILYKDCFGVLTFPFNLYKKLLKLNHLQKGEIQKALDLYEKRLEAFKQNIISNEYYDIYLAHSLKNLIKNHQLYLYDHKGVTSVLLEVEDIIELLLNIIHLLETYKNYHITFLPEKYDPPLSDNSTLYCLVKEREAVFIEVLKTPNGLPDVRLSIKEPMMVHAFEVYFKNFWELLPLSIKNKEKEISLLRRKIELLRSKL